MQKLQKKPSFEHFRGEGKSNVSQIRSFAQKMPHILEMSDIFSIIEAAIRFYSIIFSFSQWKKNITFFQ